MIAESEFSEFGGKASKRSVVWSVGCQIAKRMGGINIGDVDIGSGVPGTSVRSCAHVRRKSCMCKTKNASGRRKKKRK